MTIIAQPKLVASQSDIQETPVVRRAFELTELLLSGETRCPIGEITGPTGTGKTVIGKALSERFSGVRLCAYEGITRAQLLRKLAETLGVDGNPRQLLKPR